MSYNFPNERLTNSKFSLFGFANNFTEISFVSILHENIQVLLSTVKKTLMKTNDIWMVQWGKDSDLICSVAFLVIAKAKTFYLNNGMIYFF